MQGENSGDRGPAELTAGREDGGFALKRLARRDSRAAEILRCVAAESGIAAVDLLRRSRCRAEVAAARQLAMYLVNIKLNYGFTQIGALFGRDRTTVAHACMTIEDKRDDGNAFDLEVSRLEALIDSLLAGGVEAPELRHASR